MSLGKRDLFVLGIARVDTWCALNGVGAPRIEETGEPELFGTCAYYRDGVVHISVKACAAIGTAGRAWSYPGYVVDRTPFGVLAHELAHHVDHAHGANGGIVAGPWREQTREQPVTSYCPNDNEWFAEIFRLFVTNPDLLSLLRPKTFGMLVARWPHRAEHRTWNEVLAAAPRQLKAARNKLLSQPRSVA